MKLSRNLLLKLQYVYMYVYIYKKQELNNNLSSDHEKLVGYQVAHQEYLLTPFPGQIVT